MDQNYVDERRACQSKMRTQLYIKPGIESPSFPELLISRVGRLVGRGVDLKDLIAKGVQYNRFVREEFVTF